MSEGRDLRWGLFTAIVAVAVLAGLVAAYAESLREPTLYRAQVALVLEHDGQPLAGGETTAGLVSTFHKLIESNVVAAEVIQSLDLGEPTSKLLGRLSVAKSGNSAVLQVRVDNGDPAQATRIAAQVGTTFGKLVSSRFGQAAAGGQPVQVAVFDPAHLLPGKASPRLRRDLGWGAGLGLLAGLLVGSLGARRPPERRSIAGIRVLGDAGSPGAVAEALIELSARLPFQTVALAGDPDGIVTASLAHALADRGELTIWIRAADADFDELERLAARCAYVLVAGATFDPTVSVDAAIAVTGPSNVGIVESLLRQPGIRVLGTVATSGSEPE